MKILQQLCSVPTAPFAEHRITSFVEQFVGSRKRLKLSRDTFGNLLIELPGKSKKSPRWVFTAHMDHPGFVAETMIDSKTLRARFHGGVRAEFFDGSRMVFFDGENEITGVVQSHQIGEDRVYPESATIRVKKPVSTGAIGMWDQGEGQIKGKRFLSRVCDDLAGAAAALQMVDELLKKPAQAPVAVLLTRAEEDGFIGAMAAVLKPKLLRKSDRVIAIECSAMQPYAPQGQGAIIRTGDRTSIFNSDLTYFITQQAETLQKKDKTFQYQRALMPGGTCEATVYDAYGYTASSICVPLGNYHNMNRETMKIGPEFIDLSDWKNMVKLFVQVARSGHEYEPGMKAFKEKVEKRFERLKGLLGKG